jgi:ABC-type uncharacterized transport system auxiliary subunit
MRRTLAVIGIPLVLAVMAGCGATRPSKYYTLEVPDTPSAAGHSYPVSLLVGRFAAPHLFRDDRLVYRSRSAEMGTYEYHRWAEPPTEMLEAMLVRLLRASGQYRSVELLRSNARGDYIVRGRLSALEEVDDGSPLARVALEIELYSPKTGTTVWSRLYRHDEPVNGKSVPAVVEALNRNVQSGLAEIVAGLNQYFAEHPP